LLKKQPKKAANKGILGKKQRCQSNKRLFYWQRSI